jgi:hypothetical protein
MPAARGMLVAMTPFPASIGAGHLRAAQRACLLGWLVECYGERAVCHLRDPFRCRLSVRAAWRGGCAGRRGGGPGSGLQSRLQPTCPQYPIGVLRGLTEGRPLRGRPTPSSESSDVRWVPAPEVSGYTMDRSMRLRINDYLDRRQSPVVI